MENGIIPLCLVITEFDQIIVSRSLRRQSMQRSAEDQLGALLCIAVFAAMLYYCYRHRWRSAGTAFGTADWASAGILRAAGMLARHRLIFGRTCGGELL